MANLDRKDIHFGHLAFFTIVHIVGLYGLYYAWNDASWSIIMFAVGYFFLVHLSITCGPHRLYSHESFRAAKSLQ